MDHGADPTVVNSFGHTAYDLARDQLASDEKTVLRDKSEVRAVLDACDAARAVKPRPKVVEHADPLPEEGTAVALQLETVADAKAREGASESTAKVATALTMKKFAKKAKKRKGGTKKKS